MKRENGIRMTARGARVVVLVASCLLAISPLRAKPPGGGDNKIQSLVHANELTHPLPPRLCDELGFVRGSTQLTAGAPRAIDGIYQEWRTLRGEQNDIALVVKPDATLARDAARRQAEARAIRLRDALVAAGIRKEDVFVWPSSAEVDGLTLSCPPFP